MGTRLALHTLLKTILGSNNVYFQAPANVELKYPCIMYKRERISVKHADNTPYFHKKKYSITVIDSDPDSSIPDQIALLPMCSSDRNFRANNLNHDVFTLYF